MHHAGAPCTCCAIFSIRLLSHPSGTPLFTDGTRRRTQGIGGWSECGCTRIGFAGGFSIEDSWVIEGSRHGGGVVTQRWVNC